MSDQQQQFEARLREALFRWCAEEEGVPVDDITDCGYEDETTYCGEGTCEFGKVRVWWRVDTTSKRGNRDRYSGDAERLTSASEFVSDLAFWMDEKAARP